MDLSLDDIIKKNKIRNKNTRGRLQSGPNNKGSAKGNLKKTSQSNGKIIKGSRRPLQNKNKPRMQFPKQKTVGVVDARLKIIQKNRQRLTDARDKLSELAKQTDVRSKIKGGAQKLAQHPVRRGGRVQGIGQNISRITTNPLPSLLQRSIRNNIPDMRDPSSLIRCTINRTDLQSYDDDVEIMDVDSPIPIMPHSDLSNIKMVAQNEYSEYRQDYLSEPSYLNHHYEQPVFRPFQNHREQVAGRSGGRMSQEMRARLDTPAKPPPLYGFTQEHLSPPAMQGHRIVVSNLHSSVTHEDIKELFEDIGPLLTSRLVRPGTAEVIYKLQNDAKKAVEAYHNRQLDGQPMKCLLVNPRSPAVSSGVLRSNNMAPPPKFPVSSKSMVVPDLSAIHKALFTSK